MKEKNEYYQKVYLIGIAIITFKVILDSSNIVSWSNMIDNLIVGSYLLCMIYKLTHQTYSKTGLVLFAVMGLACFFTCRSADNFYLVFTYFAIVCLQNVDIKKVIKVTFSIKTLVIIFHVLNYILVYFTNNSAITYVYRNGVKRHFFFMGHANTFTAFLGWACLEYIYLNYEKMTALKLIVVWVINMIFYTFTDSNTGLIVISMVTLLTIFDKKNIRVFNHGLYFVAKYGFAMCSALFAFILVFFTRFNGFLMNIYNFLNKMFTGRLLYGVCTYDLYGMTWFGRTITFPKKQFWNGYWLDTMVFDNSYIWLMVLYGAAYMIIISALLFYIGKKTSNIERILVVAYVFYAVMESYALNVVICFPLLFIGKYIHQQRNDKKQVSR